MKPTLDPQTQEFLLRQIQTATTEQELFEAAMMFNRVAPHIVLSGALRVAGAALSRRYTKTACFAQLERLVAHGVLVAHYTYADIVAMAEEHPGR